MGFLSADLLNRYFQSSYFIESCQNRLTAFRTNNFLFKSNIPYRTTATIRLYTAQQITLIGTATKSRRLNR